MEGWLESRNGYLYLSEEDPLLELAGGMNRNLRIIYRATWTKPTVDGNDLSANGIPSYAEPILVHYACAYALEVRATKRSAFAEYSAAAEKDIVGQEELLSLATFYRKRAEEMLAQVNNNPTPLPTPTQPTE